MMENMTAQQYTTWLVTTMSTLDDGPDFEHLQHSFNALVEQLTFLENCYLLPSYETPRSN